jgi:TRAP-type C4-dicarboxylate transport system permease small subunit
MGLATAALLLPVFLAREFLGVEVKTALKDVLSSSAYWSWGFLLLALFSGVVYHYLSAKWVRLAWDQSASAFGIKLSDSSAGRALEVSFWTTVLAFFGGLVLILVFFASYVPHP